MYAMVFAAGLGTRLRPLTNTLPKPATPLMNRPLAAWSLECLREAGVTHCAVNTFHLAERAEAEIARHVPEGLEVRFVRENTLLGTGGGIRNALAEVEHEGPFFVMNGDIFFWPDLRGALAHHRRLDAKATMVVRGDPRAHDMGSIEVDADGRVRRMLGSPTHDGPLSVNMFTGVHVLSREAVHDLPEVGCVVRHGYRRWLDGGDVVAGIEDLSPWRDLGTPAEYLRAHLDLLRGDLRWPSFDAEVMRRDTADRARQLGVTLDEVVLGEDVDLRAGVALKRCVVWRGASVDENARDRIFTPDASVDVHP